MLLSIVNKGINMITDQEYSYVLMNFTVAHPYQMTWKDFLYKYKFVLLAFFLLLLALLLFLLKLISMQNARKSSFIDPLTGLFWSTGFEHKMKKFLKKNPKGNYFIIDYDINRFEGFNTAYGREKGDALLCHMAHVIRENLSSHEFAARIYADHFASLKEANNLEEVIQSLTENGCFIIAPSNGVLMRLTYGIYHIDDTSIPVRTMLDRAVMGRRSINKNTNLFYGVYDADLHNKHLTESDIVSYMNTAIKYEEFFLVYQPKFDIQKERIVGAEALVRWRQQNGSIVMPNSFINLFEKNGQIMALDFYVFEKVCQFQRELLDAGLIPVPISVNFSHIDLYGQNFVSTLISMTKKYKLLPSLIEIELAESALINDTTVLPIINSLHEQGFTVALDNFGSDYSSLNSLKDLPIDVLKLDRTFVAYDNITNKAQQIVRHLFNMTKALDITSIAEGVETKEQLDFLRGCDGCNIIQGFYYSKPLEKDTFVQILRSRT